MPRVSVLMPVYNAQRYLREAIDSILAQTFDDFELIAVDDGSTDRSAKVLASCADPRLRVIRQANTGIVGALNRGLAAAHGELIARMDADDRCDPHRLSRQVAYLDAHPDCIAVGTWARRIDPYGSPAGSQEPPTDHAAIDAELLRGEGGALIHATLLMRRAALIAAGAWDARYNWSEDLDLFLRLTEHGRVANLPEHLYAYRRHVASVCATKNRVMYPQIERILREAYARRGISDEPDVRRLRPELNAPRPGRATMYRNWACHAIQAGNAPIARRHALAALRHEPFKLETWRVLYWSLAA